ncbi:uncharacterized protein LOC113239827 isoform X2 [Hyposmocoma kahamanoa]|nr:uncharacterized protein LOC113239827 isoform X2 [Hyposmocoma kahamanoa]
MKKSSFRVCKNDVLPHESVNVAESYKNPDDAVTLNEPTNMKCEFDSEQDMIQGIEHRVLDRLLISALSNINNNNQYNDQSDNKEKIEEQETFSPVNKFNEDDLTKISETAFEKPSLIYPKKLSSKKRKKLISFSDTKVEKPPLKTKRKNRQNNTPNKRKKYRSSDYNITIDSKMEVDGLIISALNEGVVEHKSDEYNVNDHKIYDENSNYTQELTNLLLSNLSHFLDSISYPNFIYDEVTNDSDGTIHFNFEKDKKCTQKSNSVTTGRQVESEKDFIDQSGHVRDLQCCQVTAHSKTKPYFMDDKLFYESRVVKQIGYCDVISEEDETLLETKTETEYNHGKTALSEPDVLNQPHYKDHQNVIAEKQSTLASQTVSDLCYDSIDDLDKDAYSFKTNNLMKNKKCASATQQTLDLLKLTTDRSINVKCCNRHISIFTLHCGYIIFTTIVVIFLKFCVV